MKKYLIINYKIILWGLFYIAYKYMAFNVTMVEQSRSFTFFLYGNIFGTSKLFWDVSAFFMVYLMILKKPFVSNLYLTRTNKNYVSHTVLYGLKICLYYTVFVIFVSFTIPAIFGHSIYFPEHLISDIFRLFSFSVIMYMSYLFLLVITHKHMLSLLVGFVVNFMLLIFYNIVSINDIYPLIFVIEIFVSSFAVISGLLILSVYILVRRKDWVENEK